MADSEYTRSPSDAQSTSSPHLKLCTVEGCTKVLNARGYCRMHWARWRKHGDPLIGGHKGTSPYRNKKVEGHPLAYANDCAYEHRVVYYSAHGEGPFNCHWCGKAITWGTLHVDHLDDDGHNNAISNLVASCPLCNQKRGKTKWTSTWRARYGLTVGGVTKTVNEWALEVGISRSSIVDRLRKGWTVEAAVLTPRGKFGPKPGPK